MNSLFNLKSYGFTYHAGKDQCDWPSRIRNSQKGDKCTHWEYNWPIHTAGKSHN